MQTPEPGDGARPHEIRAFTGMTLMCYPVRMARKTYPLERLDRWLGRMLARVAGTLALIGGVWAAWSVLSLEGFTLASHWPVLAISAVLLLAAWGCFTARPSFLEMMSETPLTHGEAEARRRDVAVDDQRSGEH